MKKFLFYLISCAITFVGCTETTIGYESLKEYAQSFDESQKLYYTTSDRKKMELPDDWKNNILYHEYTDGQGMVVFKSQLSLVLSDEYGWGMGYYPFNNQQLTSITIPGCVTDIGYFNSALSLESVTIGNGVTSIGDGAFQDCTSLSSITIPDSVTSIGKNAFSNCISLTSVTIPDGVTSIGYGTFRYCTSLTNVTIGNGVTSIGQYAFADCTSLTSVTLGDGITEIGVMAFMDCTALTTITLPESVNVIQGSAFYKCTSLESITFGSDNPDNILTIRTAALRDCNSLKKIYCKSPTPPMINGIFGYENVNGESQMRLPPDGIKVYVPRDAVSAYMEIGSGWTIFSTFVHYDF